MTENNLKNFINRLIKIEESILELTNSHNEVVLALIQSRAALEILIKKGLINPKELDKRANELLEQVKKQKNK